MKNWKRLYALALCLALTLSLAVTSVSGAAPAGDTAAETSSAAEEEKKEEPSGAQPADEAPEEEEERIFSDTKGHWAEKIIEDMAVRGYAAGEGGKFYPERNMSATETILFCTRVAGIDKAVQDHIYADRGDEIAGYLPERAVSWATREMSVAVEAGIVTLEELEELGKPAPGSLSYSGGPQPGLLWTIEREDVCKFLVRAMQLEPLAKSMPTEFCLSYLRSRYADADTISEELLPYLYVLTFYKVLNGTFDSEGNRIADPHSPVTRAQMTTLMSMALQFMEDTGIETELSEYTEYDWEGGLVANVTTELTGGVLLTVTDLLTGRPTTYRLPEDLAVYKDNMLADVSFLRGGKYARLNFSGENEIETIRLGGDLTSFEGGITWLKGNKITLYSEEEGYHTFFMDRFTEVLAGEDLGDRTAIDDEAGYTDAKCWVDELGHLAAVKLWGGTHKVSGLFSAVAEPEVGPAVLTLASFDGLTADYEIPAGAVIKVNGVQGTFAPNQQVGRMVTLRVTEEDNKVVSVSIDTITTYLQGKLVRQTPADAKKEIEQTVTIANTMEKDKEYTVTVDAGAFITYSGEERTAAQIENGWFVTTRLVNGVLVEMAGYPAVTTVEGTLTTITRDAVTVLEITRADESTVTYAVDTYDPPAILRAGKVNAIAQLRKGDSVVVTLRYNEVEQIEATPREADLTGKITGISLSTEGNTLEVALDGGETVSYVVSHDVSISRNGNPATFRDLNVGDTLDLTTSGGEVFVINVTAAAVAAANRLEGKIYLINNVGNSRAIFIQIEGRPDPMEVDMRFSNAKIIDSVSGEELTLFNLSPDDRVLVLGNYSGNTFEATLIIKE